MRGALHNVVAHVADEGIILADAGSTGCLETCLSYEKDHPRGCGEHVVSAGVHVCDGGSSSRMRGALHPPIRLCSRSGIILADAGSTDGAECSAASQEDHPRGCGEHPVFSLLVKGYWGSSSRMRGAPTLMGKEPSLLGIILADAGSTE